MENPTLLLCSSTPPTETLLQNSTNHANQKKSMINFEEFIFKLAETHPNKPLPPATKTFLHGSLNRFVSEYKTPVHPPYSAMIQMALEELNERRGSKQESISHYLEKIYDNLPWAHSELLNHHLEKLCESGEIVVTRDKRYALPGCLKSSAERKRKPPRHDWGREKNRRPKRKLLSCVDENEYSEEMGPSEADIRAAQIQEREESEYSRPELVLSPENNHPLEPYKNTYSSLTMKLRPRPAKT